MAYRRLSLDGGTVEFLVAGPPDATELLLFHVGTPSAAVMYPGLVAAAAARGVRTATYSRGGYGRSSRRPGRSVADEAAISAALADRLGYERFFTVGWSGGGPVALACAALLPARVKACMPLASPAPRHEAGADSDAWIPVEQRGEWDILASDDQSTLLGQFQEQVGIFSRMTPARLLGVGGAPDARAVAEHHREEIAPYLTRSMRRAVAHGYAGHLDDNVAQARAWGFRVADIRIPVVVRHGVLDRLVDVGQGRWLAAAISGARGVFLADAGHGSIALPWAEVVDDVIRAAG
ncbi:MAG TPA: alpha/beta fold hydrolase [Candidatus Limnocylindria bacterium]|nr:alpha/beta fold hydrolase [Candidatus Limnocylindria bacterium]